MNIMWRGKSFAQFLLLTLLAMSINAICVAAESAAEPSVQEMVDALARKPATETGIRMRGLGVKKPTSSTGDGQLQLSVQFELGAATISADSKALLAKLGNAMNMPALAGTRFRIEGHTDASGDAGANLRLSERRAQGVRQFLTTSSQVEASRLSSVGKGSSEPIDRANPTATVNRRVVIVALNDPTPAAGDAAPAANQGPKKTGGTVAGTVRQIKGEVLVTRTDGRVIAALGSAMNEGDDISTTAQGSALIEMEDGAKLLVRPNTRVTLSRVVNRGALAELTHAIDLAIGAIRYVTGSVGNSRPQGVRFKTPTATIGIRGTDIDIVHAPAMRSLQASGTYVRVNRGAIELDGNDGSTAVLATNEQAFAGAPGPVMRGGKREPAVRKMTAPASVFSAGELDTMMEAK